MSADTKVLNDKILVTLKSRSLGNLYRRHFDLFMYDELSRFLPLLGTGTLEAAALGIFFPGRFQLAWLYRWPWIVTLETSNLVLELMDDFTLLPDDLQQQDDELALLCFRDFRYVDCQFHGPCE
jgi:hypothetical protein